MPKTKPRRVLRDNIQGFTKPAIRRLAARGGAPLLQALVYYDTREAIQSFTEKLMQDAVAHKGYKRKTLREKDLAFALEEMDRSQGTVSKKVQTCNGPASKKCFSFSSGIKKVANRAAYGMRIEKDAVVQLNQLLYDLGRKITEVASKLAAARGVKTIGVLDVQSAVRVTVVGKLQKHAVREGTRIVSKVRGGALVLSDLLIPNGRVRAILDAHKKGCVRVGKEASIYLAGALEYLTSNVLEIAANETTKQKRKTISPRDMMLAAKYDEDVQNTLNKLGFSFSHSGAAPGIHKELLPKEGEKGQKNARRGARNIKKQQSTTTYAIPRTIAVRYMREVLQDLLFFYDDEVQLAKDAVDAYREALEKYIVELFAEAQKLALHAKRKKVKSVDVEMARKILNM